MPRGAFINYSHPSELKDRNRKRRVSSYIGVHFRNRSRPLARAAARKQLLSAQAILHQDPPKCDADVHEIELPPKTVPSTVTSTATSIVLSTFPSTALLRLPRDGHGMRCDPFNTWPIEFQPSIPSSVDYFLQFYAPAHSIRPECENLEDSDHVVQDYFRYALQRPLMFEAIVALSRANLTVSTWTNNRPDPQTLYHYGSAITRLRNMITSQGRTSATEDGVLFAITALMGIDFLKNDMLAFQAHLAGLRHLVALRGGIDALGWSTLLKPSINGIETFWTYICDTPDLLPPNMPITVPAQPPPVADPQPVTGACLPPLETQLSTLGAGFRRLAETNRLSPAVVGLLYHASRLDLHLHHHPTSMHLTRNGARIPATHTHFIGPTGQPRHNASNLAITELTAAILVQRSLSRLERLVCISLLIMLMGCTRTEKLAALVSAQMRLCVAEVLAYPLRADDPVERDLVAWVNMNVGAGLVRATACGLDGASGWEDVLPGSPWVMQQRLGSEAWGLRDPRVECVRRVVMHFRGWRSLEELQEGLLQDFIWTDACRDGMSAAWRHVEGMMVREEEEAAAAAAAAMVAVAQQELMVGAAS